MAEYKPKNEVDHKSRVTIGDLQAQAYEWIVQYALNLNQQYLHTPGESDEDEDIHYLYGSNEPLDAETLIEYADGHQGNGWGDYIVRGGAFEGFRMDSTFWEKYAIVKDIPRSEVTEASFFSCSC